MKLRDRVMAKEPYLKSRAALILLVRKYKNELRQYRPEWRVWLSFRNRFLIRKNREGSLTCAYCGEQDLKKNVKVVLRNKQATIDHVLPLAKGGKRYDENNLVVSCRPCNEKKGDKIVSL